jgi:hypothetical protein
MGFVHRGSIGTIGVLTCVGNDPSPKIVGVEALESDWGICGYAGDGRWTSGTNELDDSLHVVQPHNVDTAICRRMHLPRKTSSKAMTLRFGKDACDGYQRSRTLI